MKMLYANFTDSSINYGNNIIEYATQQFLKEYLKDKKDVDFVDYDSFGEKIPEGTFDGLFIPGCTMITPGQNKSLNLVKDLNYNSYCLAGSLWYPNNQRKILIKNRLLRLGKKTNPNLSIVKHLSGIIGSRDRYTFNTLLNADLKTLYTGCPTLFLDSDGVEKGNYILFSFGRANYYKQIYYASKIAKKHKVIGIVHEDGIAEKVKAAGWELPLVDFLDDVELYLSYFKKAKYVISGRLHGILPALAYNKPSFYFGTDDTRLSVLHDLGITIHKYSEIPSFKEKLDTIKNYSVLGFFKKNLHKVADSIFYSANK